MMCVEHHATNQQAYQHNQRPTVPIPRTNIISQYLIGYGGSAIDGSDSTAVANKTRQGFYFNLFDAKTLQTVVIRDVVASRGPKQIPTISTGRWGEFSMPFHGGVPLKARASGDGKLFGVWNPFGAMLCTFKVDGELVDAACQFVSTAHAVPNRDGSAVCTERGYYSSDLLRKRGEELCPALNGTSPFSR